MSHLILSNTDDIENIQHKHTPKPVGFSSWKEYWCDQSDEDWPETCRFRGCSNNADGSAHVIVNDDEEFEYIIPMCNVHNSAGFSEIFSVNSGTFAVYIDKEEIVTDLVANLTDK
jgi:mannose-6-phosphate isomerase-like protein (cupin superfamily)